jgi:hypothetical protein
MPNFHPSSSTFAFGRNQQWTPIVPLPTDRTSLLAAWEWCRGKAICNYRTGPVTTNSTLEFIAGTATTSSTYVNTFSNISNFTESGTYGSYFTTTHVQQQNVSINNFTNLKDYGPETTNPTSVPKTFSMAVSFDSVPPLGEVYYLMGSSLDPGQSGWRLYQSDTQLIFQYFYVDVTSTPRATTITSNFVPVVGTKYLFTVLVQPQGNITLYRNGNTTPLGTASINVRSWVNGFQPIGMRYAGYASGSTNYGFAGRTYGAWVWNKHITTTQLTQLYNDLLGYGVVN